LDARLEAVVTGTDVELIISDYDPGLLVWFEGIFEVGVGESLGLGVLVVRDGGGDSVVEVREVGGALGAVSKKVVDFWGGGYGVL